jgi:hypothetical protein
MALQAPVQGRTGQMRDRCLERIQAVVQRRMRPVRAALRR